ncbi:MAG: hypothetical protein KKF30_07425 [Proteobacteria bacterium]|nr:hypothetical protein [Pseudomonadota bacterium]MBU4470302.1 hypothetical protein [Pseudomonadota bacterium]MCG2752714.1 hypothetical protein [Desulfobacteraceae bacterium]
MITIKEISAEVLGIIQDNSYNDTDILRLCNNALTEISGIILLPELQAEDTVDTVAGVNHTALPSDFQRNLFYCYSEANNRRVRVYSDFRKILSMVGVIDQPGYAFGVAVRGGNLYYQRVPGTAETLQIHYYRNPTALISIDDSPSCLPVHLARPLLVNYCCLELFSLLEDGMDGKAPNTERYTSRFGVSMGLLSMFIGPEPRLPEDLPTSIDWNSMAND